MTLPPFWRLDGFGTHLDIWAEAHSPTAEIVNHVVAWTFTRYDNSYVGVKREPEFPNLWFGRIPGTVHGNNVVVCSYWIFESDRLVKCDGYATLGLPV